MERQTKRKRLTEIETNDYSKPFRFFVNISETRGRSVTKITEKLSDYLWNVVLEFEWNRNGGKSWKTFWKFLLFALCSPNRSSKSPEHLLQCRDHWVLSRDGNDVRLTWAISEKIEVKVGAIFSNLRPLADESRTENRSIARSHADTHTLWVSNFFVN